MPRHILLFVATFILGALISLAARTATHNPHQRAPIESKTETPSAKAPPTSAAPAAEHPHAARPATGDQPSAAPAGDRAPVNTVCAICGMSVDPKLPTLEYQGKRIGFGCRMCPPKFKANPDKYGPYYLRNEVIKR